MLYWLHVGLVSFPFVLLGLRKVCLKGALFALKNGLKPDKKGAIKNPKRKFAVSGLCLGNLQVVAEVRSRQRAIPGFGLASPCFPTIGWEGFGRGLERCQNFQKEAWGSGLQMLVKNGPERA